MALFCAAIRRDSGYLLMFLFLSHVQVLSCKMFFVCLFKVSKEFFLTIFLSPYFSSVDDCVVWIVFYDSNQFFSVLVYVLFEWLYWCINAIFKVGKSSSSFSWHIQSLCVVFGMLGVMYRHFFSSYLVNLSYSLFRFKKSSRVSYEENRSGVYPFDEILDI